MTAAVAGAPDASIVIGEGEARCALWWSRTPALRGERLGFIGQYDARHASAARQALDAACGRLRAAGCARAVGPVDGDTWHRYRLVTWRGREPPFFLEPDNPDDWPVHFEAAGFTALAEYFSAKCDDIAAFRGDDALDARHRAAGFRIRDIDMSRLDEELQLLWTLASDAFSENFLYTPIPAAEFKRMYAAIIPHALPALVWFLERDGEAAGFSFTVPDILQKARGVPVDTVIHKTMGIRKAFRGQGLGGWLADTVFTRARALGFRQAIHALMHESNPSRKLGRGQLRDIRRYTLFSRAL